MGEFAQALVQLVDRMSEPAGWPGQPARGAGAQRRVGWAGEASGTRHVSTPFRFGGRGRAVWGRKPRRGGTASGAAGFTWLACGRRRHRCRLPRSRDGGGDLLARGVDRLRGKRLRFRPGHRTDTGGVPVWPCSGCDQGVSAFGAGHSTRALARWLGRGVVSNRAGCPDMPGRQPLPRRTAGGVHGGRSRPRGSQCRAEGSPKVAETLRVRE